MDHAFDPDVRRWIAKEIEENEKLKAMPPRSRNLESAGGLGDLAAFPSDLRNGERSWFA